MNTDELKFISGFGYVFSSLFIAWGIGCMFGEEFGLLTFGCINMVGTVAVIFHLVTRGYYS